MLLPATMKAMVLNGHGGPERYEWHEDWPTPLPGPREVVVKIGACGLNATDVNTRTGWYGKTGWSGRPVRFPLIQGADAVGTIAAVGDRTDPSLIGKRVMIDGWQRDWKAPEDMNRALYFGSECDGGFAEYARVDPRNMMIVDSPLSDAELATFQCSYTTAEAMLARADVGAGDTVLVPGASGGVGSALVQLGKRRGARVIALASEEKHAELSVLEPDLILPRAPDDLRLTLGNEAVTVIADMVAGSLWPQLIGVLERGGRYVCSGAIGGPEVTLDLRQVYLRDLTLLGSTVIPANIFADVVTYIERGEIKPLLAETYALRDLVKAQAAFEEKRHVGNIVVIP
ncbi:alcohol dehydrogenase catalytic domain-containing protein [Roseovarius sp.]|jgi:NADPH:quinone reductase-like Zn-dependent oxidoreductase